MVGEYTLEALCNKYSISKEKLVDKNNNILSYGEFNEIDRTLDYLINSLKISPINIEKCPSILYRNTDNVKDNIDFLKKQKISFSSIESCLHVLSTDPNQLIQTYNYVEKKYGTAALNAGSSILACSIDIIDSVEKLGLNKEYNLAIAASISLGYTKLENVKEIIKSDEYKKYPELFTSETLAHAKLKDIQKIINSDEFKAYPELFTSQTLTHAKLEDIQEIINSDEFKSHPELFTSETLAHAKLKDIQEIIKSDEFKEHPELFTSTTLAHTKLEDIQKIINSDEFKEHPELFTSTTLAHAKLEDIQKIINSDEFKKYPELFTSTTLAHVKLEDIQKVIKSDEFKAHPELFTSQTLAYAKLEDIQKIINSDEFKKYPELFTSTTLAHTRLEEIQEIINSDEFKEHPELFTSTTLAHAKLEDIQKIINSDEFKAHPELFTSQTLARAKLEDIQELLNLSCFQNEKYKRMLTPSIVAKSKSMIQKMPILIEMAEYYKIDDYINTNFLLLSPSQNYALINYSIENDNPLVINEKLNPIFSYQPGVLRKKYGIDIKVLMDKYPIPEKNIGGKVR